MRVGASSGSMFGVGSAAAAFVVGFLMYFGWIPFQVGVGLLIVSGIVCVIAFAGACRAHYHPENADVSSPQPPPHNLLCVGLEVRTVFLYGNMVISHPVEGRTDAGHKALIAVFSNTPLTGRTVGPVRGVRASVAPVSAHSKIHGGLWLDEDSDTVNFYPGAAVKELLLVYTDDDGSVWAVEDRREPNGRYLPPRHVCVFSAPHMMGGLSVTVELSANGQVINHASFYVELHPLSADLGWQKQLGCPINPEQIAEIQAQLGDASKEHQMIAARESRRLLNGVVQERVDDDD